MGIELLPLFKIVGGAIAVKAAEIVVAKIGHGDKVWIVDLIGHGLIIAYGISVYMDVMEKCYRMVVGYGRLF